MSRETLVCWTAQGQRLQLHVLRQLGTWSAAAATTVNEAYDRVAMHAVRLELLEPQAEAAGLPLVTVRIPTGVSTGLRSGDGSRMADAREEASRPWPSGTCSSRTIAAIARSGSRPPASARLPALGRPTRALARGDLGRPAARLTCVDPRALPRLLRGREFDRAFLDTSRRRGPLRRERRVSNLRLGRAHVRAPGPRPDGRGREPATASFRGPHWPPRQARRDAPRRFSRPRFGIAAPLALPGRIPGRVPHLAADEVLVELLPPGRLVSVTQWADSPQTSNIVGRVPPSVVPLPEADMGAWWPCGRTWSWSPSTPTPISWTWSSARDADPPHAGLSSLAGSGGRSWNWAGRGHRGQGARTGRALRRDTRRARRRLAGAPRKRLLLVQRDTAAEGTAIGSLTRRRRGELGRELGVQGIRRWGRNGPSWRSPTRSWWARGPWPRSPQGAPAAFEARGRPPGAHRGPADSAPRRLEPARGGRLLVPGPPAAPRPRAGKRAVTESRRRLALAFLLTALPLALLAAASVGSVSLPFRGVLASLLAATGWCGRLRPGSTGSDPVTCAARVLLAALVAVAWPRGGGAAAVSATPWRLRLLGVGSEPPSAPCWPCASARHDVFLALPMAASPAPPRDDRGDSCPRHGRPTLHGLLLTCPRGLRPGVGRHFGAARGHRGFRVTTVLFSAVFSRCASGPRAAVRGVHPLCRPPSCALPAPRPLSLGEASSVPLLPSTRRSRHPGSRAGCGLATAVSGTVAFVARRAHALRPGGSPWAATSSPGLSSAGAPGRGRRLPPAPWPADRLPLWSLTASLGRLLPAGAAVQQGANDRVIECRDVTCAAESAACSTP